MRVQQATVQRILELAKEHNLTINALAEKKRRGRQHPAPDRIPHLWPGEEYRHCHHSKIVSGNGDNLRTVLR